MRIFLYEGLFAPFLFLAIISFRRYMDIFLVHFRLHTYSGILLIVKCKQIFNPFAYYGRIKFF